METKNRLAYIMPSRRNIFRNALVSGASMAILFCIAGCQSFDAGSGVDRDCKYSAKNRKSYISCMPQEGASPVICRLPLKVDHASIENLFSSIGLYIGTAYRYGGKSPDGFDCSGFVQYLYEKNFRMLLPRTSGELATMGSVVPVNSLHPGDLVFFSAGGRIDHVGIFIGGERFAHASINGVKISSLRERWYTEHYACSARVITTE
jgi:murein DD-endopeptidase / murein LD-carboxypeptidase